MFGRWWIGEKEVAEEAMCFLFIGIISCNFRLKITSLSLAPFRSMIFNATVFPYKIILVAFEITIL